MLGFCLTFGDLNSSLACLEHFHPLQKRFPTISFYLCSARITKSDTGGEVCFHKDFLSFSSMKDGQSASLEEGKNLF